MKNLKSILMRYPNATAAFLTTATFVAGGCALLVADFGRPMWLLYLMLVWLLTAGLPATAVVLMLASVWGRGEPFYGLGAFAAVTFLLSFLVHRAGLRLLAPMARRLS